MTMKVEYKEVKRRKRITVTETVEVVSHIGLNDARDRSGDNDFDALVYDPVIDKEDFKKNLRKAADILSEGSFLWDATAEGPDFWNDVEDRLRAMANNVE